MKQITESLEWNAYFCDALYNMWDRKSGQVCRFAIKKKVSTLGGKKFCFIPSVFYSVICVKGHLQWHPVQVSYAWKFNPDFYAILAQPVIFHHNFVQHLMQFYREAFKSVVLDLMLMTTVSSMIIIFLNISPRFVCLLGYTEYSGPL